MLFKSVVITSSHSRSRVTKSRLWCITFHSVPVALGTPKTRRPSWDTWWGRKIPSRAWTTGLPCRKSFPGCPSDRGSKRAEAVDNSSDSYPLAWVYLADVPVGKAHEGDEPPSPEEGDEQQETQDVRARALLHGTVEIRVVLVLGPETRRMNEWMTCCLLYIVVHRGFIYP